MRGRRRRPKPRDARRGPAEAVARRRFKARATRRSLGAGAAVRGRLVRRPHRRVSPAVPGRPPRRPAGARSRRPARSAAPGRMEPLRRRRAAAARPRDLAGLARGRALPRRQHPRFRRALAPSAPRGRLARGRLRGRQRAEAQPGRLHRHLGPQVVSTEARPAFYALSPGGWRDYVTVLHPPYTAWHLSYVAIGACLAPTFHTDRLLAALAAFFLGLGVGAHALDELQGRPLATRIPEPILIGLTVLSLAGAVAIGIAG